MDESVYQQIFDIINQHIFLIIFSIGLIGLAIRMMRIMKSKRFSVLVIIFIIYKRNDVKFLIVIGIMMILVAAIMYFIMLKETEKTIESKNNDKDELDMNKNVEEEKNKESKIDENR